MDRILRKLGSLGIACALVGASSLPTSAFAAEPASEADRTKELFENGRRLFDEGSYDAAISAFQQAYEMSGNANLLFNIHLAYEKKGDFEEAIVYLDKYRALAPSNEQEELARTRESLQTRMERAASDAAAAAAREAAEDDDSSSDDSNPPPPSAGNQDTGQVQASDIKVFGVGPIVATSVAVVGAAVGIGLGVVSSNRKDDAEGACTGDLCRDSFDGDAESSQNMALGANISFGIAAASALVAVTLVVVNSRRKARAQQARVLPAGAGVAVRF